MRARMGFVDGSPDSVVRVTVAVVVVVVITGPWMMNTFVDYTRDVFKQTERVGSNTGSRP